MNDATIGHQCPDCVSEGRRGQRSARTAFGGTRAGQLGYVTTAIIAINSLVMVASAVVGGPRAIAGAGGWFGLLGSGTPLTRWGEVLGYAFYGGQVHGVAAGEWYRLVTAMFLHYGVVHLLLNMMLVAQIGRYLEEKLGPLRFAALYLLGGLGGTVASYALSAQTQAMAGASTATFALVAAAIVINRRLVVDTGPMIGLLITNLFFTFAVPNISVTGHLGGLAAGAAVSAALAYARLPHRTRKQVIGCSVILVVLIVVVILRTMRLVG